MDRLPVSSVVPRSQVPTENSARVVGVAHPILNGYSATTALAHGIRIHVRVGHPTLVRSSARSMFRHNRSQVECRVSPSITMDDRTVPSHVAATPRDNLREARGGWRGDQ